MGCGHNKFVGWINADFYKGPKFWKKYPNKPDWMSDLRYLLNCDSNYWDGVFTEHTLKHLLLLHVKSFKRDIENPKTRMLAKGFCAGFGKIHRLLL